MPLPKMWLNCKLFLQWVNSSVFTKEASNTVSELSWSPVLCQGESPPYKDHCHWIHENDILASEIVQHSRENTGNLCFHSKFEINSVTSRKSFKLVNLFLNLWCEGVEWEDPVSSSSLWLHVMLVAVVEHWKIVPMVPKHRLERYNMVTKRIFKHTREYGTC